MTLEVCMEAIKSDEKMKMKVFYDGLCVICAKEIEHYKAKDIDNKINFVDISSSSFDPTIEGLSAEKVQKVFHVKDTNGVILTGVEGFIAIWNHLNIFKPLATLANHTLTRPVFDFGYYAFTKLRPFLPRKKCDDGTCNI